MGMLVPGRYLTQVPPGPSDVLSCILSALSPHPLSACTMTRTMVPTVTNPGVSWWLHVPRLAAAGSPTGNGSFKLP